MRLAGGPGGWQDLASHEQETEEGPGDETLVHLYTACRRYVAEQHRLSVLNGRSAKQNLGVLTRFADFCGPELSVRKLRKSHIEKWRLSLAGKAPTTVRSEYSIVRSFCRWAVDHELLRTDPCAGMPGPKVPQRQPRALTAEQVAKVLLTLDERGRAATLLMVQEGLRVSSVVRLTTDRVDLVERSMLIWKKGGGEDWLPLSDETVAAIEAYLAESPAGPGAPLIRSYTKPWLPIGSGYLSRLVSDAMRAAGVKQAAYDGRSAHAFRHTCAGDMLDHGADLRDVQVMLGHASLSSTVIYTKQRIQVERLRKAAGGRKYTVG